MQTSAIWPKMDDCGSGGRVGCLLIAGLAVLMNGPPKDGQRVPEQDKEAEHFSQQLPLLVEV